MEGDLSTTSIPSNTKFQPILITSSRKLTITTQKMSTASCSTSSLVSTQTYKSDAPLRQSRPQKDYAAAFASLQSTYGTSGFTPSPVPKTVKAPKPSSKPSFTPPPVTSPTKDYESAFAALSSSYGFGGGLPSLPRKVTKAKATKQSPVVHPSSPFTKYQAAHGDLSSSYGFSGGAPCLPRRS